MAEIKIYRRFYCITSEGGNETYTLFDPQSIVANVFNVTQGNSLVESNVTVTQSSTGFYYAQLNGALYNSDDDYKVVFDVVYEVGSSSKSLESQFKLDPVITPKGTVQVELDNPMQYEVQNMPDRMQVAIDNQDVMVNMENPLSLQVGREPLKLKIKVNNTNIEL